MHRPILAALLAGVLASPALADTLIDGANGLQVDRTGKLEHFTGVLIGDDGKVVHLLKAGETRPNAAARIDVHGQTLLPGLIDAHGHVMELGRGAIELDLVGSPSLADMQARLKAYAAANPNPRWIIGRGWNQESWPGKAFPTSADLDAVVSDRPVWLVRVDGHAAVGNSAALREAGVTAATQAPDGGRIDHGLFTDKARDLVEAKIPPPDPAQIDRALAKAQAILLAYGVTAAADMGTAPGDWAAMRRLGDAGGLQVRILSYAFGGDTAAMIAGTGPTPWLYGDRLRMGGVKLYADGALGSRGAWLKAPYSDAPTRGLPLLTPTQLHEQADRAASAGFQLAVHAIGDAANAMVITEYERLAKAYPGDRRWRIEHAQIVDPVDISRLAPAGIIASMQPTHQTSDRLMAEKRLGANRLGGAYAWHTIQATGVHLPFGSDFPVESPNPFPGLAAAISRQDMLGQPPGGWRSQERVSLNTALAGFTREAAYAGFAENRIGSLDPGHWADFILIDRDISKATPIALGQTKVRESWIAGRRVWSASAPAPGR